MDLAGVLQKVPAKLAGVKFGLCQTLEKYVRNRQVIQWTLPESNACLHGGPSSELSCKLSMRRATCLAVAVWTRKYLWNTKRPQPPPDSKGVFSLSYMPMFRKTAVFFGHFGQIRPFPVTEPGHNCQKAHPQTKTFHMSPFPGLYDHLLQRNSLEMQMFKKTMFFLHFGHFRGRTWAKTVKRHIYRPRPFIWAHSYVSMSICYKETAWKSSCFEKPLISDILANFGHFR